MGDDMVIRFQVSKFCIVLGIVVCIISLTLHPRNNAHETVQDNIPTPSLLIIDAGHGGSDGGAVAIDGTHESRINLEIATRLNLLGKLCGINTIMTRNSEEIEYPQEAKTIAERKIADQKARLRLIQDYPYAILYSIHQNSYPSESVSGIQVLYGHDESGRELGQLLQERFNEALSSDSRRVATEISDDIYLMKHCNCTAVLIECGFISNARECALLQEQSYQKKLTMVMLGTYMEYTKS